MDKFIAILYIISCITWIVGFYKIKKTDKMLNGCTFIVISIFAFMCYQASIAFVLKYTFIPLNNLTFAVCNLVMSALWGYIAVIKKNKQEYIYAIGDMIAFVIFFVAVLYISSIQFGSSYDLFNYQCTWDSSVHLEFARDFAKCGELPNLYFMALNMGLWLQSVWAFNPFATGCQMFIWSDISILLMCACLFWHLIRYHIKCKSSYILGIIFTLLYTLGYPLNNMVFGTSYLGSGNDIVIFLMIIMMLRIEDRMNKKIYAFTLLCGCIGLMVSYSLFTPIMFASILIYFAVQYCKKKVIPRKVMISFFAVLIIMGVIAAVLLQESFWNAVSGLEMEGQIYRNISLNFVFFVPFLLMAIKETKTGSFSIIMFWMTAGYVLVCLLCVLTGHMSGYYYFKNYYVLWLMCFYISFQVIQENIKNDGFMRNYLIAWVLLLTVGMSRIGTKINSYTDEVYGYGSVFGEMHIYNLFDLYRFNLGAMKNRPVDDGTRQLFLEVAEMNKTIEGSVYFVGAYQYALQKQFSAIANQPDIYYFDITSPEEYIQRIKDTSEYVCVVDPEYAYWDITEYLSTLEVIYQNERGYIAKVQ